VLEPLVGLLSYEREEILRTGNLSPIPTRALALKGRETTLQVQRLACVPVSDTRGGGGASKSTFRVNDPSSAAMEKTRRL